MLSTVLTVLALIGAVYALVLVVLNKALLPLTGATRGILAVLALLELGLLVQTVVGFVRLAGLDREISTASFVGYLVGALVIPPIGVAWAAAERTRWSAGVLAVACFSIPVTVVRLGQIWAGHA